MSGHYQSILVKNIFVPIAKLAIKTADKANRILNAFGDKRIIIVSTY